jgi:hypothetical protein
MLVYMYALRLSPGHQNTRNRDPWKKRGARKTGLKTVIASYSNSWHISPFDLWNVDSPILWNNTIPERSVNY